MTFTLFSMKRIYKILTQLLDFVTQTIIAGRPGTLKHRGHGGLSRSGGEGCYLPAAA